MSHSSARRFFVWGVAAAGAALAAFIALRLALLDGWLRTVRIDGPSMAPAFCGMHLAVTCSDCGIAFRVDGEHLPENAQLVCPNCGFRELEAAEFSPRRGDTVLVDRWPHLVRMPRRWEVVAYDDPHAAGAAVKRVVGLPGETIAIRGGDLHVDGRIVRKSLAEFWQLAVLVHDDTYRPRKQVAANKGGFLRWRPVNGATRWQSSDGEYRFDADKPSAGEPDWLEYVHWRCDASLTPRDQPAAILDNDSYNQAQPRRLNEVFDLALTCQAELSAGSALIAAIRSRGSWLQVRIDAQRDEISASQGGRRLVTTTFNRKLTGHPLALTFGHFDEQFVVAIDGDEVFRQPLDAAPDSAGEVAATGTTLKISATGSVSVGRLQVWRDLYWLEPHGTDRPWTAAGPLAAGDFFVLGDNPPVSLDSRHWQPAGVPLGRIRGSVIPGARAAP